MVGLENFKFVCIELFVVHLPRCSEGVQGAKPPQKTRQGGGVGGGNALRRAAEAARKLAITRNIRNKEIAKILLAHSNFLAPTGARRGAQGRPRHRRPFLLGEGGFAPFTPIVAAKGMWVALPR